MNPSRDLCNRAAAVVQPTALALIFPMLDDRVGPTTVPKGVTHHVWTAKSNLVGWRAYLGQEPGGEPPGPWAVPARADTVSGLPPTYIGVGNVDLFLAENVAFADRLQAADVAVTLQIVPGAFHGFTLHVPDAPVSITFESDYSRWLSALLQV